MLIEGPLNISIGDPADGQGRVLVVAFKPEFQSLDLPGRVAALRGYMTELHEHIEAIADPADHTRAGMLIMVQFLEELLPHIAEDEIEITETIILHIRQESQAVALTELLRGI